MPPSLKEYLPAGKINTTDRHVLAGMEDYFPLTLLRRRELWSANVLADVSYRGSFSCKKNSGAEIGGIGLCGTRRICPGAGTGADPELEAPATFWGEFGRGSGAGSSGYILGRIRARIRSWKLRPHSGGDLGAWAMHPELQPHTYPMLCMRCLKKLLP